VVPLWLVHYISVKRSSVSKKAKMVCEEREKRREIGRGKNGLG